MATTLRYKPQTKTEKFAEKIFFLLVENFPHTYYVGGMVRDLLLKKKVTDIDIATSATPIEVISLLRSNDITCLPQHAGFGVVVALEGEIKVEVTTLRQDEYQDNRYPRVTFVSNPKVDSQRRDFTVNALYFQPNSRKIMDFHGGLPDLRRKRLKFIGEPKKRIEEDPLRIVRALRFHIVLDFTLEKNTQKAIEHSMHLLKKISDKRIETEIQNVKNKKMQSSLRKVINNYFSLDRKNK